MDKFNEPKMYKLKSSAVRAGDKQYGRGKYKTVQHIEGFTVEAHNIVTPRAVGKHPALAAPYGKVASPYVNAPSFDGIKGVMLGTVSRDTLIAMNDKDWHSKRDPKFVYDFGLYIGKQLGLVVNRWNPAHRRPEPYIVNAG